MLQLIPALCVLLIILLSVPTMGAATVSSPNGKISASIEVKEHLEPYPAGKRLCYSISFNGKTILLDSTFGLDFKGQTPFGRDLRIAGEKQRKIDETWTTAVGKRKRVWDHTNELILTIEETSAPQRSTT